MSEKKVFSTTAKDTIGKFDHIPGEYPVPKGTRVVWLRDQWGVADARDTYAITKNQHDSTYRYLTVPAEAVAPTGKRR